MALDVPHAREALALVERLGPRADFVKVGLQLFTAAGPAVVRELRRLGLRVFLDLKLHDIPNTVAHAVHAAAGLGVELLTLHASGGPTMLAAARRAADAAGEAPRLLAVTVLTSLSDAELGTAWGRSGLRSGDEVERLAGLAADAGLDGVVAAVPEVPSIRARAPELRILTPGIRLAGGEAHDQARVATPAEAAALGVDYVVLGRAVTAAADPAAALQRALAELAGAAAVSEEVA